MKTKILTIALAALTIGLLASCDIWPKGPHTTPVTGVTLDKTELTLTVGDPDVKLTATVAPENATDTTVSWTSDKPAVATVDQSGNVHAVAAGTATITATTTDGGKTATCDVTVKAALPADALAGEFTIDASGKKVHFSQGNLVATIDAPGAPTAWKFTANQYDYLGAGGANKNIGSTAGDVDLFGWSTEAANNNWGIHTKTTSTAGYTDGNFKDWGTAIDSKGTWRTLSKDEWTYLFFTRKASTVSGTADARYAKATVNDIKGIILLPDTYTHPEGVTLLTSINTTGATFTANTYDLTNWTKIESAGAVFLPAAGYRFGSNIGNIGAAGSYWLSTANGSSAAYGVSFNINDVNTGSSEYRTCGFSVRLVTDVK